jgi:hypothetical protein
MTADEAQKWLMESKAEIYHNPFGDPPEAAAETVPAASIYLRIPAVLKEQIDAAAKASGQSTNAWAIRCFERCAMPVTLDQCASDLADLLQSGVYSERRIDLYVDSYLVGFGPETAAKRQELADLFVETASVSELRDRIRDRILRRDPIPIS